MRSNFGCTNHSTFPPTHAVGWAALTPSTPVFDKFKIDEGGYAEGLFGTSGRTYYSWASQCNWIQKIRLS